MDTDNYARTRLEKKPFSSRKIARAIASAFIAGFAPTTLHALPEGGQLTAGSAVIQRSGVLFGAGAQVDVGGLVASTLNLSNAEFLAGRYAFAKGGPAGSVVNHGTITAAHGGYVALLGPRVINDGIITTRLGTVALAAGNQITLNLI